MPAVGIDFGTTNSVISTVTDTGDLETTVFARPEGAETIFPTQMTYWQEETARGRNATQVEAGQWAVDAFMANSPDCRFLKSIKTFAASPNFTGTTIYGVRHEYSDLMRTFLARMLAHAEGGPSASRGSVVVGRPIRFAGVGAQADLAMTRYQTALRALGFSDLRTVYEPLAAAYYFVRDLQGSATIFVGDFGGGTTDYSIIRLTHSQGKIKFEPLAARGLGLAGDRFDARIVQHLVAPALGKGTTYRSFDKLLEIPNLYYSKLSQWSEFSNLRGSNTYREIKALRARSTSPDLLDRFIHFIESEMHYELSTRIAQVKKALSTQPASRFTLEFEGGRIDETLTRTDFESWIAPDIQKLDALIDETLDEAGLTAGDIDSVFLTGGTSMVPLVSDMFRSRFGNRLESSQEQLVSVSKGLALIAQDDNADEWIADRRVSL